MKVIGVMSGSSLDGLDLAYVQFVGLKGEKTIGNKNLLSIDWTMVHHKSCALPIELKDKLRQTTSATAFELAHTESSYSKYIAEEVSAFIKENDLDPDLLGVHGHTILHLPKIATSWQLLNGGMIAALTQLPTVCDFRNTDMAIGGQGTPMAVLADRDLYPGYEAYINLGGIANISLKTIKEDGTVWAAYDLCACNQLLNFGSQKAGLEYDDKGQLAKTGEVNSELMALLESDPYLALPYPKSLDNSYIKEQLVNKLVSGKHSVPDMLRTIVEFIATQIAQNIKPLDTPHILITGGGAKNDFLIKRIKAQLGHNSKITLPCEEQIDYKEAILIAYAAYLRHLALPNFVPNATGARMSAIGGALYLPPVKKTNA